MARRREEKVVPRPPQARFAGNVGLEKFAKWVGDNLLSEDYVRSIAGEVTDAAVDTSYNTDERWVSRGDPASADWSLAGGTLTDDGAWHDLDLSTVHVDIADKMVLLRATIESGGVAFMYLRTKGNSNAINVSTIHPPSGGGTGHDLLVIPDEDGVIQYKLDATATTATLTVAAWEQGFSGGTVTGASAADVLLNTTHRTGDGTDHSQVASNAGDIVTNTAAIALNTTHRTSDGTDHANVVLNDTHRTSAGTDHSDVGLNNTHRTSDGSDHTFIDQDVTIAADGVVFDGLQVVTKMVLPVSTVSGVPT